MKTLSFSKVICSQLEHNVFSFEAMVQLIVENEKINLALNFLDHFLK